MAVAIPFFIANLGVFSAEGETVKKKKTVKRSIKLSKKTIKIPDGREKALSKKTNKKTAPPFG